MDAIGRYFDRIGKWARDDAQLTAAALDAAQPVVDGLQFGQPSSVRALLDGAELDARRAAAVLRTAVDAVHRAPRDAATGAVLAAALEQHNLVRDAVVRTTPVDSDLGRFRVPATTFDLDRADPDARVALGRELEFEARAHDDLEHFFAQLGARLHR